MRRIGFPFDRVDASPDSSAIPFSESWPPPCTGRRALEPAVLFLDLFQPRRLGAAHPSVLLAPGVEGRLADAVLAEQLVDGYARLRLLQHVDDLEPGAA